MIKRFIPFDFVCLSIRWAFCQEDSKWVTLNEFEISSNYVSVMRVTHFGFLTVAGKVFSLPVFSFEFLHSLFVIENLSTNSLTSEVKHSWRFTVFESGGYSISDFV